MSEAMKDSGIEWIGDIPDGWDVRRFKDVSTIGAGNPAPKPDELTDDEEAYCFLRVSDLSNADNGRCISSRDRITDPHILGLKIWRKGTFVFPKSGESIRTNARGVLCKDMAVVSHLACMNANKKVEHRFLHWLLNAVDFESRIIQTALPALGLNLIGTFEVPYPPIAEQQAIADFLDRETSLIDQRLSVIERKKGLLGELRKSIIHEAVTKGLNKSAAMKDSGIEWIGEIPGGWETSRFKNVFTETTNKGFPQYQLLAATQHAGVIPKADLEWRTVEAKEDGRENFKLVSFDDFVISLRSFEGGIEHSMVEGIISPAYTVLKPGKRKNIYPRFFKWFFKSSSFISGLRNHQKGIREGQAIAFATLKNDLLPLPPLAEQQAIADFLDRETSLIDGMLSILDRQESLLKEQRKALVHEVVTGKRRVI